ncbi:MAG: alpha-ketoacid dehydrogenase subunit beta [Actinomycetota bacterium]|nr:alpha-ketoacid dehydrogenase subunit beta [Actinomycetota bacterium]
MAQLTMIQAINATLVETMEEDERVMVLGEDVGKNGGVFRVTDKLQERFGEERVVDTPLAEAGIIGSSIGLAVNGFRPIAEIQFAGFLYPAFDQLASQAARFRLRSGGRYPVPLVVRVPFSGGIRAPELHSDSFEALFAHTPGLKVAIPSDPYEAKGLLRSAIEDPDPVLFLEPMKLYRTKGEVPDEPYSIPLGEAKVVKEGEDVTVVAWGPTVPLALKAAEALEERRGTSVEVVDLRTVAPFDRETVANSVEKTGRAVVVHEAPKTGGFGAEVAAGIMEGAFLRLEAPVGRVCGYDTAYPGAFQAENEWMPDLRRLTTAIEEALDY